MDILEKATRAEENFELCYHCLGRQFAQLSHGYGNDERGKAIAYALKKGIDTDDFEKILEKWKKKNPRMKKRKKCEICNSFFKNIKKYVKKVHKATKKLEFDTFLIGCKPTASMLEKEEHVWEEVGIEWTEPLKGEINREIGKRLEEKWDRKADLKKPEVAVVLDLSSNDLEVNVNPLFVFGIYKKLKRDIPQTKWPSGKYKTSVEEIIAKPFMKATKGESHSFHGMGREDIDALCLGGRPFVFEVKEPVKRKIDLEKMKKKVNKDKRVEINDLKFCERDLVAQIKQATPDKSYRALVELSEDVEEEDLEGLKDLVGTIRQKTPERVLHRRADLQRYREIENIKWKKLGKKKIELEIKAESGTYIKEFVSGDDKRTRPSVSEKLGCDAVVKELDVSKIHFTKEDISE